MFAVLAVQGDWAAHSPAEQQAAAAAAAAMAAIQPNGGVAAAAIAAALPAPTVGAGSLFSATGTAARSTAYNVLTHHTQQQHPGHGLPKVLGLAAQPLQFGPQLAHSFAQLAHNHSTTVVHADGRAWLLVSLDGAGQHGLDPALTAAAAAALQAPPGAAAGPVVAVQPVMGAPVLLPPQPQQQQLLCVTADQLPWA